MLFWTAFILGLSGSLHCVGMCGPIMLAIPTPDQRPGARLARLLVYHSGRLLAYAGLGLLVGGLGWGLQLANAQGSMAIVTGLGIIVMAIFRYDLDRLIRRSSVLARWQLMVRNRFSALLKRQDWSAVFGMGMVNGFLPCGLVYLAIITAINASAPWQGAVYLVFFGLGTLPLLLAVSLAGHGLARKLRLRSRWWQSALLLTVGLFFLWRGFNFVLPQVVYWWQDVQFAPRCF